MLFGHHVKQELNPQATTPNVWWISAPPSPGASTQSHKWKFGMSFRCQRQCAHGISLHQLVELNGPSSEQGVTADQAKKKKKMNKEGSTLKDICCYSPKLSSCDMNNLFTKKENIRGNMLISGDWILFLNSQNATIKISLFYGLNLFSTLRAHL